MKPGSMTVTIPVEFKYLEQKLVVQLLHKDARQPSYATDGAAGLDLHAVLECPINIYPGDCAVIPTGVAIQLPTGHVGMIRSRSGLAFSDQVEAFHGTIDEDYRGELKVLLKSVGHRAAYIEPGDRIAQLLVVPVTRCDVELVSTIDETDRGLGGFGSTGSQPWWSPTSTVH